MSPPVVRGQSSSCSVILVSGAHPQGPRWTTSLTIITVSISEEILGKKGTSRELTTPLFTSQWSKLVIYLPPNDNQNVFSQLGDNMSSQWAGRERNVGGTWRSQPQIIITREWQSKLLPWTPPRQPCESPTWWLTPAPKLVSATELPGVRQLTDC